MAMGKMTVMAVGLLLIVGSGDAGAQEEAAPAAAGSSVTELLQASDRALVATLREYLEKHPLAADREQAYMVIFERAIENDWYVENEATARAYLKEMPDGTVAPLARIVGTMSRARQGQFESAVEDFRLLVMGLDQPDQEEFAANFADSLAGAALAAGEATRAREIYGMLTRQFPGSPTLAQKVGDETARIALVGTVPPKFEARTVDGKPFELASYQGRYLLIDFWATWCQPNVVDLPRFQTLRETYGPRGFEIASVSLDENPQAVSDFVNTRQIDWPQLHQGTCEADLVTIFKVASIPSRILIGPDGKILRLNLDPASLETLLEAQLPASAR